LGLAEDIVISIVVFLVVSLRNTNGTVFQGANSIYSNYNNQGSFCDQPRPFSIHALN
jgi:hypothetical protein